MLFCLLFFLVCCFFYMCCRCALFICLLFFLAFNIMLMRANIFSMLPVMTCHSLSFVVFFLSLFFASFFDVVVFSSDI